LASAGAAMICQCANVHRTPVVVCTGLYKLSPMYPFDIESLIEVGDTGKVLEFEDGKNQLVSLCCASTQLVLIIMYRYSCG
jgi:translation initiation factor 2B subunit (eIF-2B alpha/beta/delta family)